MKSLKIKETLTTTSFTAGIGITLIGAYLKIIHAPAAETILIIGIITSLFFIAIAIYEVNTSHRIDRSEKVMWTIGLLLMSSITGLVYILSGRSRIVSNYSKTK